MAGPAVCVFCGSSEGIPAHQELAEALGRELGARGGTLVYGGASCGLMGRVADATLAAGGKAHGVIPGFFGAAELEHPGLTVLETVDSMHVRKLRMIELADVFVVLPGGFGTLDELFEVLTLAQLGGHAKPTGFLDVGGYYGPLLGWIDGALRDGYLKPAHRDLFLVREDPAALLDALAAHPMPEMPPIMRPSQL